MLFLDSRSDCIDINWIQHYICLFSSSLILSFYLCLVSSYLFEVVFTQSSAFLCTVSVDSPYLVFAPLSSILIWLLLFSEASSSNTSFLLHPTYLFQVSFLPFWVHFSYLLLSLLSFLFLDLFFFSLAPPLFPHLSTPLSSFLCTFASSVPAPCLLLLFPRPHLSAGL